MHTGSFKIQNNTEKIQKDVGTRWENLGGNKQSLGSETQSLGWLCTGNVQGQVRVRDTRGLGHGSAMEARTDAALLQQRLDLSNLVQRLPQDAAECIGVAVTHRGYGAGCRVVGVRGVGVQECGDVDMWGLPYLHSASASALAVVYSPRSFVR